VSPPETSSGVPADNGNPTLTRSHIPHPTTTNGLDVVQATGRDRHRQVSGAVDDDRLQRHLDRAGWFGSIPEGHFAIVDPFDSALVSMWRVKSGRLTPWPKEARTGPRLFRRDVPRDPVGAGRVREAHRAAVRTYREAVEAVLARSPEEAAARFASVTFRCSSCNRALKVPESNSYGLGPECRSWMPAGLLGEYARQVAIVRVEFVGGAA